MNLSNSVAIITGAASGLGYATAQKLIKEKAKVAIFDMSATAKQALVDEFGEQRTCSTVPWTSLMKARLIPRLTKCWKNGE